jgi:hypothetical protein
LVSVPVAAEITFAKGAGAFCVQTKNPSRQILAGSTFSKLSAKLVEIVPSNCKACRGSFFVAIGPEPSGSDARAKFVGFVSGAADRDAPTAAAALAWRPLPPAIGKVSSNDPPKL